MRTAAPDLFSATTAVGLALLVAVVVVGVWTLSWLLLRTTADTSWRWVALAGTTGALLTLGGGWLLVGAPAVSGLLPGDWIAYHRVTAELSDGVLGGAAPSQWQDRAVFFYLMALPHRLLGSSGFVTVAVNAALLGGTIVVLADLTRRLADGRTAVTAAWLTALLPPLALWSALPHREALVLALALCGAWVGVRLAEGPLGRPWESVGLVGAAVVLLLLARGTREEVLPVLALTVVLGVTARLWRGETVRHLVSSPVGLLVAAMAGFGLLLALARPAYRWLDGFAAQAQIAFYNLHRGATSAIGPEPVLEPTAPMDLVVQAPPAVARALWGPPPGIMLTVQPLYVIDAAFFWLLTPLLVLGLVVAARQRWHIVWVLVVPALVWAGLIGLTLGNWGIVSRMRITSWALLLPVVAIGLARAWELWHERRNIGRQARTTSVPAAANPAGAR